MREGNVGCRWRLASGVAAFGALALVASLQADPQNLRILQKDSSALGEGPAAGAQAQVIISDEEKARGQAAGPGGAESFVYRNDDYIGNFTISGQRFSYKAQTSSKLVNDSGFPIPNPIGVFIADDMTLGGGWTPGTPISSFTAWANRSGGDQDRLIGDGSTTVTLTLWDGDPLNEIDTTGDGFASAPIPGASCTFTIPNSVAFASPASVVKCNLAAPVVPPHDTVWMVFTSTSCRMFWPLVLTQPTVGSNQFDVGEVSWDADAGTVTDGVCCNAGGPLCGPSQGATQFCPGDANNAGGRCTDGDSENSFAFNFGGPCVGDPDNDSCVNYWAQIFSPATVSISLVPREGQGSIGIVGNEILYTAGGGKAELDIRVGDWDPSDTGVQLKAWQAQLDPGGLTSGLAGELTFSAYPCVGVADCTTALGGNCSFTGNPCSVAGDCTIPGELCAGPECGNYGSGIYAAPNPKVCLPAYIGKERLDYVFRGLPGGDLDVVDLSLPNFRWASAGSSDAQHDPSPFPAAGLYAGTLLLDISSDAKGTFTVPLEPPPLSVLVDANNLFLPLIGVSPALVTIQTGQCCDLSAQPFVCLADDFTAAECSAAGGVFDATKTCADDCGCLTNDQCADGDSCTVDRCVNSACVNTPVTVPANSCCDSTVGSDVNGGGTIASFNDGNECTADSCSNGGSSGVPVNDAAARDGETCGNPPQCSYAICQSGACNLFPVAGEACASDQDCLDLGGNPAGRTCDVAAGTCSCIACFHDLPAGCADEQACRAPLTFDVPSACVEAGTKINVDVHLGESIKKVTGGQFTINWDPTCLQWNSWSGVAPYDYEIDENIGNGTAFIAVGVNPFGGPDQGTNGNVDMATISFTKLGNCNSCDLCFGGVNPAETLLTSDEGQAICADTECSPSIDDCDNVDLNCPLNQTVNADCDFPTAIVTWPAVTGSSDCGNPVDVDCVATHESGLDLSDRATSGGEFPIGDTTICCDGTSSTGAVDRCCWTVSVNDETSLDVTVQLSPILNNNLVRCIEFGLYADCVQPPLVFSRDMLFGGLFDHVGHFTESIKIPSAGQWICITAQDQLHSLRSCDFLECSGGSYHATFKGDPFFGGNWLTNGNLDAWKKSNPNASHDVIDILDFGMFVFQYGTTPGRNTPCGTAGPHADINGDGVVDALDFSFVSLNFLASSKECCCGSAATLGNTLGRTEVSVRELRAMGLNELTSADLNNDGLVNMDDMSAFMAGTTPTPKAPVKGRSGGTVRSR